MSFENYPVTEPLQQQPPVPEKNWRNLLTIGLVISLLATWGYIIWDKNRTRETIQQKENVIATTTSQRDVLQKELEDATMRYDKIKTSSSKMMHIKDSVINNREKDINSKKEMIRQLLAKANASKEELAQAKTLISSLNGDIENYKKQVEILQGEKIVLTQQKETITKERDQFIKNLDSAKLVLQEKDELIDVASTLKASNFLVLGINEISNGREKETTTAKRVDKLRISFDIDENRVALSGTKGIYVCITSPDGTLITEGQEKFNTRDGKMKLYTQKIEFYYIQGQRQTLNFDWRKNGSFITGDYKIEVYNNGYKIGEGIRTLKKGGLFS